MVSWENSAIVEGNTAVIPLTTIRNGDPSEEKQSSFPLTFRLDLISMAYSCIRGDDYDDLKVRLESSKLVPCTVVFGEASDIGEPDALSGSLLHAILSSKGHIPLDLIRLIVEIGGVELVSSEDEDGDTPLHLVVVKLPQRTDIAAYLLEQAPQVVFVKNRVHLRPIDMISHKIIMIEEAFKYVGKEKSHEADMDQMWETVHCLAMAASQNGAKINQPLLHSCVVSSEFPLSLLQRAIARYGHHLQIPNENGDLPVHLVAKTRPYDKECFSDMDDVGELFVGLLKSYSDGATKSNHEGLSPLGVAIQHGHGWNSSVLQHSLNRYPDSIRGTGDLPVAIVPFMLQQLLRRNFVTAACVLLKSKPQCFYKATALLATTT